MLTKLKDLVGNIFHIEEKEKAEEERKTTELQQKLSNVLGINQNEYANTYNPFLKKDGSLFNPNLNYQNLLNNPNISQKAKSYISQATGLTPTNVTTTGQNTVTPTIATKQNATTITPTQSVGESDSNIVNAAKNYIGTPYVWGGESMSEGGMDCSGFVYNALKDAGYDVGRTTAQGYRNYGTKVNQSNMQPGDLVFFGKNGKATHIGIYVGNGQMVHSSGGSSNTKANPGKGVSIANVNSRKDLLEVRRYA